jgi:hypothetical protein
MADGNVMGRAEREAYWRRVIEACEASGQSMKAYCQEAGLSYSNCQWWKSELKRRDRKGAVVPMFAEVHPISVVAESAGAIEVALAQDRVVRVRPGFDAGTLAAVVRVLEGLGVPEARC